MLTSCSGDGPPKITAGWLTLELSPFSSREVVRQIVLVEDGVARPEILLYPLDRFLSRVDQQYSDAASGGAEAEGGPVGLAHDHEVGRLAGGDGGGELVVLLGLAGAELDHAGGDDDL